MEAYLLTHLYHRSLSIWYETITYRDATLLLSEFSTALSPLLLHLCSQFPVHHVLLLSSDGRIHCAKHMDEPAPPDFRVRRYIKINNTISASSVSHIISYIYQLISIEPDGNTISLLDAIGLIQFVLHLITEHDIDTSEWTKLIRKHLFGIPPFALSYKVEWKKLRNHMLRSIVQPSRVLEVEQLTNQEEMLQRLSSCYHIIETLHNTIQLQEERITWLEELVTSKNLD